MTDDTTQHSDIPDGEALPQQEKLYRAPARFGNIPVASDPLGWDRRNRGFRNHYPFVSLPTQIVERVSMGRKDDHVPNRLVWGDNLHFMRQLPDESIDLIYIDPPFFSNRIYNVIWGEDNEQRSFSDIWDGGLDGYLIWLNARLYEMKRLLKPNGSIYVHCDWHASHYIKVEMDKIFGYENFLNEIIWHYDGPQRPSRKDFLDKHDSLLRYSKTQLYYGNTVGKMLVDSEELKRYRQTSDGRYYYDLPRGDYSDESVVRLEAEGRIRRTRNGTVRIMYFLEADSHGNWYRQKTWHDVWHDIPSIGATGGSQENIGYPTQKPEALLERIIKASSKEGDTVADFFMGGGTTASIAMQLKRSFVGSDQSRVAVTVTADRLRQAAENPAFGQEPPPDFTIEHWGIYEAEKLAEMPPEQFRQFILDCYDARIPSSEDGINGYKGSNAQVPIWVGEPSLTSRVSSDEVNAFAQAISRLPRYTQDNLRDGIMLAWGFAPDAVQAADTIRERGDANIDFVRLQQTRIDSPEFRDHIASQSTDRGDYRSFLTFVQPPEVSFTHKRLDNRHYEFNASDTESYNPDGKIINIQWDFDYNGRVFQAERRAWKERDSRTIQHTFRRRGTFNVACKVQDDKGGEGMLVSKVEVT